MKTTSENHEIHPGPIIKILYFPDKKTVVTVSKEGTIKVWELSSGVLHKSIRPNYNSNDPGLVVAVRKNHFQLIIFGTFGTRFVDLDETGEDEEPEFLSWRVRKLSLVSIGNHGCVFISQDGQWAAIGNGRYGTVRRVNLESLDVVRAPYQHFRGVGDLYSSVDGRWLISVPNSNEFRKWFFGEKTGRIWDLEKGIIKETRKTLRAKRHFKPRVFIPSYNSTGIFDFHSEFLAWDLEGNKEIWCHRKSEKSVMEQVFLAGDDQKIILTEWSGGFSPITLRIFDAISGLEEFKLVDGSARLVKGTVDGDLIFSGSGTIKIWNIETRSDIATFSGPGGMKIMEHSPDRALAGVVCGDNTVKLFDRLTGQVRGNFKGDSVITTLGIFQEADEKIIVIGEESGRVHFLRGG